MDSFYLHFDYDESEWIAEMRFDAGFMTPELRELPFAPPPTVAMMERRSEEELQYMRAEMLDFVFQQFEFFQGETQIGWTISIPGFEDPPYKYEFGEDGGVFFFLNLSAKFEGEEPLRLRVSDDCEMIVAAGVPNGREGDDDRDIYVVQAGAEQVLLKPGTRLQPIAIEGHKLNEVAELSDEELFNSAEELGVLEELENTLDSVEGKRGSLLFWVISVCTLLLLLYFAVIGSRRS